MRATGEHTESDNRNVKGSDSNLLPASRASLGGGVSTPVQKNYESQTRLLLAPGVSRGFGTRWDCCSSSTSHPLLRPSSPRKPPSSSPNFPGADTSKPRAGAEGGRSRPGRPGRGCPPSMEPRAQPGGHRDARPRFREAQVLNLKQAKLKPRTRAKAPSPAPTQERGPRGTAHPGGRCLGRPGSASSSGGGGGQRLPPTPFPTGEAGDHPHPPRGPGQCDRPVPSPP